MVYKIFTLTGVSGSGKTTIMRELLKRNANIKVLPSITTRTKRDSDVPGEYRYIGEKEFENMQQNNAFLWDVDMHGSFYGTAKVDVDYALKANHKSIMLLVPEVISILKSYTHFVLSFYIISPPEDILRQRLQNRGDDRVDIEKRILDCKKWDKEAGSSDYIFIDNSGALSIAVESIVENLN